MKIEKKGNATFCCIEKDWNKLTDGEKDYYTQMAIDQLFIVKHGPAAPIKDEIKKLFITLAENNIPAPSIPFALIDLVCQYHLRVDESERADEDSYDMLLNLFCATMFQIREQLRKKDQTIDTLSTALKAKSSDGKEAGI